MATPQQRLGSCVVLVAVLMLGAPASAAPGIAGAGKRITPEGALDRLLDGLVSFALTVERAALLERVVEIERTAAEASAADQERYITVLLHVQDLSDQELARAFGPIKGEVCDCDVFRTDTLFITDTPSRIERLLRRLLPVGHWRGPSAR